jgi:hypothetical protein
MAGLQALCWGARIVSPLGFGRRSTTAGRLPQSRLRRARIGASPGPGRARPHACPADKAAYNAHDCRANAVGLWFIAAEGMFFWLIWRFRAKPGVPTQYITGKEKHLKRWINIPHYLILVCDVVIIIAAVRVWVTIKQTLPTPDLIVLSDDVFTCAEQAIADITPVLTMVGGDIVAGDPAAGLPVG